MERPTARRGRQPGRPAGWVLVRVQSRRPAPVQAQPAHGSNPTHRRQINHKGRAGKGDGKMKTDLEALAGKHSYLKMSRSQQDG